MWAFDISSFDRHAITSPRDFKDKFIAFDSFYLSRLKFGLDLWLLSEPARSTNDILPLQISPFFLFKASITTLNIKCDLLDWSFISVDDTLLDFRPWLNVSNASSYV